MKKVELTDGEIPIVEAALRAHRDKLEPAIRKAKRGKDHERADIMTDELRMTNDILNAIYLAR
jgi:hypothetical protein